MASNLEFKDLVSCKNFVDQITTVYCESKGRCFSVKGDSKTYRINEIFQAFTLIRDKSTQSDLLAIKIKELRLAKLEVDRAKLKQCIVDFIHHFLMPYIKGEITREKEPVIRVDMMSQLLNKLGPVKGVTGDEIQEMALDAYIDKGVVGFYHFHHLFESSFLIGYNIYCNQNLIQESVGFNVLLNTLSEAIHKDFPERKFNDVELKCKTVFALHRLNESRTKMSENKKDFPGIDSADKRRHTLEMLWASRKVFEHYPKKSS